MKKKQLEELKLKTKDELVKMKLDLEIDLKKIKTEMMSGKIKNMNELRTKMKDKARILTFMKGAK